MQICILNGRITHTGGQCVLPSLPGISLCFLRYSRMQRLPGTFFFIYFPSEKIEKNREKMLHFLHKQSKICIRRVKKQKSCFLVSNLFSLLNYTFRIIHLESLSVCLCLQVYPGRRGRGFTLIRNSGPIFLPAKEALHTHSVQPESSIQFLTKIDSKQSGLQKARQSIQGYGKKIHTNVKNDGERQRL